MDREMDLAGTTGLEVAIVGMAGRFPGAGDVDAFWRNIRDGVESVSTFSVEELRERGVPASLLDDPDYVRAGVMFDGMDRFDADFFGYTPREAEQLDPQQRVFLECAWEALEHAGYAPRSMAVPVGVFAGDGPNLYLLKHLLPAIGIGKLQHIADLLGLMSGNSPGSLCTRVAYKLNLKGPAVNVQTACSTSLTAVHLACRALQAYDCDMALAGGVWLNLLQEGGYLHQAGAILSPDGHCRAFDVRAAGTLIGSGAGVVALKRLSDALRDGDSIHAVIKGSAANNDGAAKVGFTAPSVEGQAEVIRAAQLLAEVTPESIAYVEAHGTGTTLGDPIEIAALSEAFRSGSTRKGYCAVGSVKTNIGHLDAAAGVSGLIKTALALENAVLPPSLNFETPNPQIDFAGSPFYVNTETRSWPQGQGPRRAGVSAFGIGGTNIHVVLEEAPAGPSVGEAQGWQILPLSARDETALRQVRQRLAEHLSSHPESKLADVAHTLQLGRQAFATRAAVVANHRGMAVEMLTAGGSVMQAAATPEVVFLFPGGGTQHARMGEALYRRDAFFRAEIDRCCELLRPQLGKDLRELLFPPVGADAGADRELFRMALAQPALFVVEYALARWWMHCGVQPALMLGHSLGEYVAACLAGVFRLEDALSIVATRGRLMETLEAGAMTAVALPEAELASLLGEGCDLAAVNGESLCVLAGPVVAVERVEAALAARQQLPRRLHVAIASHSSLVEPIVAELERAVAAVPRQAPRLPFVSNVSGRLITAEEAVDPAYWGRHLRSTVRFADGLATVFATPGRVLMEVGPGETLAGLARPHPGSRSAAAILASQAHPQQHARNEQQLANAVATLWCAGVAVDWAALHAEKRRRVPLPTYPFQRRRYWVEPPEAGSAAAAGRAWQFAGVEPGRPEDAFYLPVWKRVPPLEHDEAATELGGCTLVLAQREEGLAAALAARLRERGRQVVWLTPGVELARRGPDRYSIRVDARADHEAALRRIEAEHGKVSEVFHLWSLDGEAAGQPDAAAALDRGFHSLMALAQAWESVAGTRELALTVMLDGAEDVTGLEPLCPEKATVFALCKVIGQEYPHIACRVIDMVEPTETQVQVRLADGILAETAIPASTTPVAYRGLQRWTKSYERMAAGAGRQRLREGGVYLITGGLGGVGLALAQHLAANWKARLVLFGRTPLPARADWEALAVAPEQPEGLRQKLQRLLALEAAGGEVLTLAADVSDPAQMQAAVAAARARFGALHGIVHAAGSAEAGMIKVKTRDIAERVFAPKLQGTRALLEAAGGEALDFVLLCSSVSSMAGGLGKGDYAAANAYLDALAAQLQRSAPYPVFSVDWDAWRDLGMAAGMVLPDGIGMDGPQGALAFEAIVNGPAVAQIVVSTTDLDTRLGPLDSGMLDVLDIELPAVADKGGEHPRPPLSVPYAAPEGELETRLAALWAGMLGIAPIGIDDNLFELGGDSLLAIQILARVRKAYGVELHPATFFKAPTIGDLAILVETRLIEEIEKGEPAIAAETPASATV